MMACGARCGVAQHVCLQLQAEEKEWEGMCEASYTACVRVEVKDCAYTQWGHLSGRTPEL